MSEKSASQDIRIKVREHYGKYAEERSVPQKAASCCSPDRTIDIAPTQKCRDDSRFTQLYETPDVQELPEEITNLSMGCGDPISLASLKLGQVVVDLGSGGGIDCFLAAKKVGPTGHVIGVDMTPKMIEKSRANKALTGVENVEFRLGEIEHLPVSDNSADVVISNCVINLSPDKLQVFREIYRVLKPGGRLAVSDIVTSGPLPEEIKQSISAWAGCIAGALEDKDYIAGIKAAGFIDIKLDPVHISKEMIDAAVEQLDLGDSIDKDDPALQHAVFSARVTATKPNI